MQPDTATIQFIHTVFNFVIHQFPAIVLFILLGAILYFALTEKRKRQLVLTASQEEQRLKDLVDAGKLSHESANILLEAALSLPEVHEAYPLPDIHLRLTSAFTKIFSIFKIMLVTSKVALVAVFPLLSEKVGGKATIYASKHANIIFSLIFIIIVILSITHFRKSMLITRGNSKAAAWVAGIWLFDLLFLRFVLLGADNSVFIFFAVFTAVYALWVLVWRNGARSFLSNSSVSVQGWVVQFTFILFLGLTYTGIFVMPASYNTQFTQQQSDINFDFSTVSPHSKIESIHLIQATQGNNTKNFTELLVSVLKEKLPNMDISKQEYGTISKESINLASGMVLVVSEVDLQKDQSNELFNEFFSKLHTKSGFKFKGIGKEKHSFTVQSYAPKNPYAYHYDQLKTILPVFNEYPPKVNCTIAQNYQGDKGTALKQLSTDVVENLLKQLKPYNESANFNTPKYFAAQPKVVENPELSFFEAGTRIGRFHSVYYNNFTLHQFPLTGKTFEKEAIVNELKAKGWVIESADKFKGQIIIVAKSEKSKSKMTITIPIPIDAQSDYYGEMETYSPFGYVVMYQLRTTPFKRDLVDRFRREDIRSFSACSGMKLIPKNEIMDYLDRLLSDENLTFNDLETMHRDVKQLPFMIPEKDYKCLIELRMLNIVVEDVEEGKPKLGQLDKVIDILLEEDNNLDELAKYQPIRDYYIKAKLSYDTNAKFYKFKKAFPNFSKENLLIVDFSESPEPNAKRRLLVTMQKEDKKVVLGNMGVFKSMTHSCKDESTGGNIYRYQGENFFGGLSEAKLTEYLLNKNFVVGTYYDFDTDTLTVEAIEPVGKKAPAQKQLHKATIKPIVEQNDIKLEIVPTYGTLSNNSYKFRPFEPRSIYITIDPKVQHKYLKEDMLELYFSPNSTVNNRPIGEKLAKDSNSFGGKKTAKFYMGYGENTFLPTKEGIYKLSLIINARQRNKTKAHGSWRLPDIEHIVEIPKGEEEAYKFLVESGASSFLEHPYGVRPTRSDIGGPWNRKPAYEPLIKLVEEYDCPLLKQDIYRHCLNVLSYDCQHHGEYFKTDKNEVIKVMCRIDSSKTIESIERSFKSRVSKGKKVDVDNYQWWKATFNLEMEKLSSKR